ncbi:hypothetical protein NEIRO03_2161 [Nematocida sp. AWRm78]|nr:hypothetical protein NEIRO03_2161 [Nematocida sp. AWRm78]
MPLSSPMAEYSLKETHTFEFFLFLTDASERQLIKFINDLEKKLLQIAKLSYHRIKDCGTKISISTFSEEYLESILTEISNAYNISLCASLPPYLLSNKNSLLMEFDQISSWNNTSIHYNFLKSHFTVTITGNEKKVFKTRTEMYKLIEKMHGRAPSSINTPVHAADILASGGHVYFESKILCTNALLATASSEYISASKPKSPVFKKDLVVDKVSLLYSLTYMRLSIEDILVKNETYITNISYLNSTASIELTGFCKKLLKDAVSEMEMLFISIITLKIQKIDPYTTAKVFLFNLPSYILVVGETCEVKKILREIDMQCEISVLIPPAIEEFICGKKNGKLNKVARESDCNLTIRKDAMISVLIQGGSHNAEFSLSMIEDELPTEHSFYLHEKHHKRIIGYGGKSIQRLMKKNGVYIKFDSTTEAENNVIIRTPTKNKESLYKMYKDVMELAGETPYMMHGAWHPLSFSDFYALGAQRFRFRINLIEVFTQEPVDIQYYLVELRASEKKRAIYTIGDKSVVASDTHISESELITTDTWANANSASTYFSWKYEEPLFCDKLIWGKHWREKGFSDSWNSTPWKSSFTE